jgi:hypothetical protein
MASWWKLPSHDEYPTSPTMTLSGGTWYSPTLDAQDKTKAMIRLFAVAADTQVSIRQASDAESWTTVTTISAPVNQYYYFDYTLSSDYLQIVSTKDLEVTIVFE